MVYVFLFRFIVYVLVRVGDARRVYRFDLKGFYCVWVGVFWWWECFFGRGCFEFVFLLSGRDFLCCLWCSGGSAGGGYL